MSVTLTISAMIREKLNLWFNSQGQVNFRSFHVKFPSGSTLLKCRGYYYRYSWNSLLILCPHANRSGRRPTLWTQTTAWISPATLEHTPDTHTTTRSHTFSYLLTWCVTLYLSFRLLHSWRNFVTLIISLFLPHVTVNFLWAGYAQIFGKTLTLSA